MDEATKCVVTFESKGRDFDPKAVAKILQKWVALAEKVKAEAEVRGLSFLYQRLLWLVNFDGCLALKKGTYWALAAQ